ncbi:MAG: lactate utilization protein C [Gammaproteobacteria bacterium]|nr:lactate utilization protein C [Gammaproteobacteria bacterium]
MMADSARDRILGRIRAVTGSKDGENPGLRISQPPLLIRPRIPSELLPRFVEKLELGGGSISQVAEHAGIPAEIGRFLDAEKFPATLRAAPALRNISWGDGLEVSYGSSDGGDLVSVTPAFCAIAETGSLLLVSGEDSPTTLNFLPDVHIVIVESDQLLAHPEDAWAKLRELGQVPRTVNVITGPSKTADIEQTLQIGAHGPRKLHVILVHPE